MDFKHKIIHWNCQGLKPYYNEVSLLISEYKPSVFCFQETFLKPDDNISLKGFNIYVICLLKSVRFNVVLCTTPTPCFVMLSCTSVC